MLKTVNTFLVKCKPLLIVLVILLTVVGAADSSAVLVGASPVLQQPARFLSSPFYGTTTVNSVYDHEYPTYDNWPETDVNNWVRHYDNTTTGGGARQSYDGHNGIDYDLNYEYVRAAAPSDVVLAGWDNPAVHEGRREAGLGLYVHLRHENGYDTLYGHMSVLKVRSNDQDVCETGEFSCILGISGNTGWSSGPHLHFELEPPNSTASVNPYGWIGGAGSDPWQNWSGLASHDVWLRYPSITNSDVYPSGAPLTAPPINENEPGAFMVDDGDTGFVENPAGCWTVDTTAGWTGDHRWRNVPAQNPGNCTATWNFPGTPGRYNVFVYVPNIHATTDAAQYTIRHTESPSRPWSKQTAMAVVGQSDYPNAHHPSSWVYVGTYYFSNQYGTDYVRLESAPLDPVTDTMMAADAVRFAPVRYRVYLPLGLKCYPAIVPATPVLNAIDNSDYDGNYTVSWQPAFGAETYTLQEATNPSFSGAATVYTGADTSWSATNKPVGTYYYRVRATNCAGSSNWSNTRSTTVLPPTWFSVVSDTMVLAGYPTTNYGDTGDMWAGYDTWLNPDGKNARSLVRFDLSAIPAGTSISQATLWLYLRSSYDVPNTSRVMAAYRVASLWTEGGVTWNTRPGLGGKYGEVSVPHADWRWYAIDVTDLVRSWLSGQYSNYGMWVLGNEDSGDPNWRGFCTREGGCGAWLQITYSGTMGAGAPPGVPGVMPETFRSPLPLPERPDVLPEMFRSPLLVPERPDVMPEVFLSPLRVTEP